MRMTKMGDKLKAKYHLQLLQGNEIVRHKRNEICTGSVSWKLQNVDGKKPEESLSKLRNILYSGIRKFNKMPIFLKLII